MSIDWQAEINRLGVDVGVTLSQAREQAESEKWEGCIVLYRLPEDKGLGWVNVGVVNKDALYMAQWLIFNVMQNEWASEEGED